MKRFNFNNKPLVESPYPPKDTNVLWVDVDKNTGKVSSISKFNNGTWKIILQRLTGALYKMYVVRKKDISNCTYNMVDLGLPSGLKWADRNVGATSPEDFGSYFQWGDTNAYTYDGVCEMTEAELAETLQSIFGDEMEVTADNVHEILTFMFGTVPGYDLSALGFGISIDKVFNWDNYFDTTDYGSTFNKYNSNGGLTVLESIDDAATINMSSDWRMPTVEEIREFITNTTPTFIDLQENEYSEEEAKNDTISEGNLKGVKFTGSNGNSIFIPAAGICSESLLISGIGSSLWSSSLDGGGSAMILNSQCVDGIIEGSNVRFCGQSVRGVHA